MKFVRYKSHHSINVYIVIEMYIFFVSEDDNILIKDLGAKLLLGSNTLTPVLKKLENIGLVERIRDKNDERNVYIKLTQKGIKMKEKAITIPKNAFCQTGLSLQELTDLRSRLKNLLSNLTS